MTITLREDKGSELTWAELDGNFTDLISKITKGTTPSEARHRGNNARFKP